MQADAIVNRLMSCEYCVPRTLSKTVAAIGTPERISLTDEYFRKATIMGLKADRTANTGIIYLGVGATNDTQPFAIAAGAVIYINAPVGSRYNWKDWWLDAATAADGVVILYS